MLVFIVSSWSLLISSTLCFTEHFESHLLVIYHVKPQSVPNSSKITQQNTNGKKQSYDRSITGKWLVSGALKRFRLDQILEEKKSILYFNRILSLTDSPKPIFQPTTDTHTGSCTHIQSNNKTQRRIKGLHLGLSLKHHHLLICKTPFITRPELLVLKYALKKGEESLALRLY